MVPSWVLPSSCWGQRRSTSTLGSVTCRPTWGGVATAQGTGGAAGLRDKSPRAHNETLVSVNGVERTADALGDEDIFTGTMCAEGPKDFDQQREEGDTAGKLTLGEAAGGSSFVWAPRRVLVPQAALWQGAAHPAPGERTDLCSTCFHSMSVVH